MGEIAIRPARPEDCEAVAAMVLRLAAQFGVKSGTTGAALRHEAFGPRPTISILVAAQVEELIGYLIHQDTFSTWRGMSGLFVVDVFVVPERRSGGVGLELLRAAARDGIGRGARFLRLDIDESNAGGRRFYERLGFRELVHDRFLVLDEPELKRLGDGERPA
jgi:ribosomal protein S18 acetylase RimI-like enzyme